MPIAYVMHISTLHSRGMLGIATMPPVGSLIRIVDSKEPFPTYFTQTDAR